MWCGMHAVLGEYDTSGRWDVRAVLMVKLKGQVRWRVQSSTEQNDRLGGVRRHPSDNKKKCHSVGHNASVGRLNPDSCALPIRGLGIACKLCLQEATCSPLQLLLLYGQLQLQILLCSNIILLHKHCR